MNLQQHDWQRESAEVSLPEKIKKANEYLSSVLSPNDWRVESDCVIAGSKRNAKGYRIWIKSAHAERHFEYLHKNLLVDFDSSLTKTTDGWAWWFVGLGQDHKSAHAG